MCQNAPEDKLETALLFMTHPQAYNPDFCRVLLVEAASGPSRPKSRDLNPLSYRGETTWAVSLNEENNVPSSYVFSRFIMCRCSFIAKNRAWPTDSIQARTALIILGIKLINDGASEMNGT